MFEQAPQLKHLRQDRFRGVIILNLIDEFQNHYIISSQENRYLADIF